ncbi:hypothetical protein RQP54_07520 [Curvibacter sp. APW13]|uniref:hypothetical protein n=1 Tax=Curvibacter sp. APW13 TaxID=3077236 RepID=UPI0028DDA4D6|nr:hypothetical protein [Curvibacter sp. APW13]MDT8990713.1 hypothetical protein [Curvibacter sp. APW13]
MSSVLENDEKGPNVYGDDEDTSAFLSAFQVAWKNCTTDYQSRLVNSEHTLQSALYFHLRNALDPKHFVLYTEMVVRLGEDDNETKNKSVIDLVVSRRLVDSNQLEVIGAIEVKFTPRGCPVKHAVEKDLRSLSVIRNRRSSEHRANLNVERFAGDETQVLIHRGRKMVIAALIDSKHKDRFDQHCNDGIEKVWGGRHPKNLVTAIAYSNGPIATDVSGAPIDRSLTESL